MSSVRHWNARFKNTLVRLISLLFRQGAPIPKRLERAEELYPLYLITRGATPRDVEQTFRDADDNLVHPATSPSLEVFSGEIVTILNLRMDKQPWEDFLQNAVFLREFRHQLHAYLHLHRRIWEEVSAIREATHLRYRDFPGIRTKMMGYLKTLRFMDARLRQMGDIARARQSLLDPNVQEALRTLGMLRFENYRADQRYILDLWTMTIKYAEGTLVLLESLFQENTQRELNALKLVTFITAMTGFFGMNVAFPWEDRWPLIAGSTYLVGAIIVVTVLGFYLFLRQLI